MKDELRGALLEVRSIRCSVYLLPRWTIWLNVLLGVLWFCFALLCFVGDSFIIGIIGVIALTAVIIAYNVILRARKPTHYTEYVIKTSDKQFGEKTHRFLIFSKKWATYSDGDRTVEAKNGEVKDLEKPYYPECRYDELLSLDYPKIRTDSSQRTVCRGTATSGGKTVQVKLVLIFDLPYSAKVGRIRIRFADINDKDLAFSIPSHLSDAVQAQKMVIPKDPRLHVEK